MVINDLDVQGNSGILDIGLQISIYKIIDQET